MGKSRMDKLLDTKFHDPYMDKTIYKDPTICPVCKLVYHDKTWHRDAVLYKKYKDHPATHFKECPACRKVKDNFPLGIVILEGNFIKNNQNAKQEILNLIRHEAEKEELSNPLARIMKIEEKEGFIEIRTTTEGLASKIGKAVHKAYHGELNFTFSDDQKLLRIYWRRES